MDAYRMTQLEPTAADCPNQRLLDEVNQAGAWFPAWKTASVWVRASADCDTVDSKEGRENLLAGDVLCRGESGDLWPQSKASLLAKYRPTETTDADGWRRYEPRPERSGVLAACVGHPFTVETDRGQLAGKGGDYLLKDQQDSGAAYPQNLWIVDRVYFEATYRR
jgi:hypothetical protein